MFHQCLSFSSEGFNINFESKVLCSFDWAEWDPTLLSGIPNPYHTKHFLSAWPCYRCVLQIPLKTNPMHSEGIFQNFSPYIYIVAVISCSIYVSFPILKNLATQGCLYTYTFMQVPVNARRMLTHKKDDERTQHNGSTQNEH